MSGVIARLSVGRGLLLGCVLLAAGCAPVSAPFWAARPAPSSTSSTAAALAGERATVTRVVDGDTVHVRTAGGQDLDVRVLGVDTPETKKPRTPVQCGGPEATAAAHALLDGRTVTLAADASQAQVDRYGRALRYLTLPDGRDYSLVAVGAGSGRAYKLASGKPPTEWPQLTAAEHQARAAGRGLWGPPCHGQP